MGSTFSVRGMLTCETRWPFDCGLMFVENDFWLPCRSFRTKLTLPGCSESGNTTVATKFPLSLDENDPILSLPTYKSRLASAEKLKPTTRIWEPGDGDEGIILNTDVSSMPRGVGGGVVVLSLPGGDLPGLSLPGGGVVVDWTPISPVSLSTLFASDVFQVKVGDC